MEQTPFRRDSQTDFTNIGTAFRTGEGVIEMTLKPGISVSGTVVLRKNSSINVVVDDTSNPYTHPMSKCLRAMLETTRFKYL